MLIVIKTGDHRACFLTYMRLKVKLRVLLVGYIIAIVTCCIGGG